MNLAVKFIDHFEETAANTAILSGYDHVVWWTHSPTSWLNGGQFRGLGAPFELWRLGGELHGLGIPLQNMPTSQTRGRPVQASDCQVRSTQHTGIVPRCWSNECGMRILYAFQGTGNGYHARAQEFIPILQTMGEVDVWVSGGDSNRKFGSGGSEVSWR